MKFDILYSMAVALTLIIVFGNSLCNSCFRSPRMVQILPVEVKGADNEQRKAD